MVGLCTNYEGARGPQVRYKRAPPKNGSIGVWHVVSLKKVWEKRKKMMGKLWQKKMHRLWQKKNWKKLT